MATQSNQRRAVVGGSLRRPSLVGGIIIYGLGDLANRSLASLLLIPIYTHFLSVSEYGIITTLTPLAWLLIPICGANVPGALVRFYHDDSDPRYRKRLCSTVIAYLLVAPFLIVSTLFVVGPYFFERLFPNISFFPYAVLLLWFVYFSLIPQALLSLWRAEEKPLHFALLSCGGFFVTATGIVLMVTALDQGVYGKMLAEVVVAATMAVLSLLMMRTWFTRDLDFGLLQGILLFSAPLVPHLIARWLLNYVSRIQLLAETDLHQAGLFGLGSQLGMLSLLIAGSVMNALAPWFYRTAPKEDSAAVIARISTLFLGGFIVITTGVCIFAKEIIAILATDDYAPAYPVALLIAVGSLFLSMYNFPMLGLMYLKKTHIVPVLTVLSAAITIGANAILIPRWGIMGAAIATVAGQVVLCVSAFAVSQRLYPIQYEYSKVARLAAAFVLLYAASLLLPQMTLPFMIGAKILIVATLPFWLLMLRVVTRQELVAFGDSILRLKPGLRR